MLRQFQTWKDLQDPFFAFEKERYSWLILQPEWFNCDYGCSFEGSFDKLEQSCETLGFTVNWNNIDEWKL